MYLYQPCLLAMALYHWAFDESKGKQHASHLLFPLVILVLSELELTFQDVWVYPASLLLPMGFLFDSRGSVCWEETLTASLIGGLLCWKAADHLPLFPGIILLGGALLLLSVMLLCRKEKDRLSACAIGSLFFELFFCLKEYMLFSYCVLRLGSRDALSLGTVALCLYGLTERIRCFARARRKHAISISN